jgi:hypothetical protein
MQQGRKESARASARKRLGLVVCILVVVMVLLREERGGKVESEIPTQEEGQWSRMKAVVSAQKGL